MSDIDKEMVTVLEGRWKLGSKSRHFDTFLELDSIMWRRRRGKNFSDLKNNISERSLDKYDIKYKVRFFDKLTVKELQRAEKKVHFQNTICANTHLLREPQLAAVVVFRKLDF